MQPDSVTIDEIIDNFSLLDAWDDRYRYVIELGRGLEPLPEAERTDAERNTVDDAWRKYSDDWAAERNTLPVEEGPEDFRLDDLDFRPEDS